MSLILSLSRFFLPVLTVVIIALCVRALLFGRHKDETIAHLTDKTDGSTLPLNMWETSIGRSKACDICLEYDTVSRFHAVIARRLEGWYIYDINSKGGIMVNGEKIEKKAEICHDDAITFGSVVTYHFLIDDDPVVGLTSKKKREIKKQNKKARKQQSSQQFAPESYTDTNQYADYDEKPYRPEHTYKSERKRSAIITEDGKIINLTGIKLTFGSDRLDNVYVEGTIPGTIASIDLYEDGSWVISRHSLHDIIYLNNTPVNAPLVLFNGDNIRINNDNFKYIDFIQ